MSQFRRQDDRRRRVLMTTASATAATPASGSRSRIDSMREARRPTLVYGTRVREGLRGRWFSLVPVDRSAVAKLIAVLSTVVLAMVLMNDATVRFVSIESRPAFVDVFQIYRPGSLGRYVTGVMYLALAGAGWMTYQLRRFRNDDFRGNYRLWQWIVGVSLVASVATVVPLLAMLGAAVEMLMGRRIALSGHDWIGLFLVVGGAVLALRTIAETWQHRTSLALLIGGWICIAIPVAAQWNMIAVDTMLRWSVVTSAPLLAVSLWFTAAVIYLRSLYCEVRGIEPATGMIQRLREATPRWFSRRDSDASADSSAMTEPPPARKPAAKVTSPPRASTKTTAKADAEKTVDSDTPITKRRWFGLLPPAKPKPAKVTPAKSAASKSNSQPVETNPPDIDDESAPEVNTKRDRVSDDDVDESPSEQEPTKRRRWWPSLRRGSKATSDSPSPDQAAEDASPPVEVDESDEPPKKRRFGLGSLLKRKASKESEDTDPSEDAPPASKPNTRSSAPRNAAPDNEPDDDDDDSDGEEFSDDDIDWSSMNKAERRRMRKQLKRGGRAA
ncbi:hypothetical protein [Allorhodopirellula heiligendammensis]|uniref:Uncharacterized protein n=1 Tax=Allorhodopirellula heiligendammensis TaxID=2714739 RepID=A0A5C6C8N8_9BACT|nr:hypothetical protein [Allorhodopirellula heiligendammensis]TWU19714.1 hypothetical protein Poly21_18890 [Allorhodopirellula heiligendammensis]